MNQLRLKLISRDGSSSKQRHSAEFERYRQTDIIAMRLMATGKDWDDSYSEAFEIVASGGAEAFLAKPTEKPTVRDRAIALGAY